MQNPTELASFLPSAISSISRETAEKINEDLAIFVSHIPLNVQELDLQAKFSKYGTVVRTKVVRNRQTGEPKGYGFVYFADTDSVERAIDDTDGVPFFQDTSTMKYVRCKVTQADPKNTIYVGNIPPTLNEDQIIHEIERICNERILRFELHMNPDGSSKCYGWARFADHETALLCIQTLNSTPFPSNPPALLETDKPLATKFALPRAIPPKLFRSIKSLYVKNIDPSCPIEEIRDLFGGPELVERVFLPTQKGTSLFLGTAIIFYHFREDAEKYIRLMDGKVLNGRIVHVEWCLPKSPPMGSVTSSPTTSAVSANFKSSPGMTSSSPGNVLTQSSPQFMVNGGCFGGAQQRHSSVSGFSNVNEKRFGGGYSYSSCPQSPTILSFNSNAVNGVISSNCGMSGNGKKYVYQPSSLANEFTKYQKSKQQKQSSASSSTMFSPLLTHKLQLPQQSHQHTFSFTPQSLQPSSPLFHPSTATTMTSLTPSTSIGIIASPSTAVATMPVVTPVITSAQGMPSFPIATPTTFSYSSNNNGAPATPATFYNPPKSNNNNGGGGNSGRQQGHYQGGTPTSMMMGSAITPLMGSGSAGGSGGMGIGTPAFDDSRDTLSIDNVLSEEFSLVSQPSDFKHQDKMEKEFNANGNMLFGDGARGLGMIQRGLGPQNSLFGLSSISSSNNNNNNNTISNNIINSSNNNGGGFCIDNGLGFVTSTEQKTSLAQLTSPKMMGTSATTTSSMGMTSLPSLKDMATSSPLFAGVTTTTTTTMAGGMKETFDDIDSVLMPNNNINNDDCNNFEMTFNINKPIFGNSNL